MYYFCVGERMEGVSGRKGGALEVGERRRLAKEREMVERVEEKGEKDGWEGKESEGGRWSKFACGSALAGCVLWLSIAPLWSCKCSAKHCTTASVD